MERNSYLDSLKFVLIALVVFGHVIEPRIFGMLGTPGDKLSYTIHDFIYSFHMPLFIFVSGYFSKNISWQKYQKSFLSLFVTYLFFLLILATPDMLADSFQPQELLSPKGIFIFLFSSRTFLWYLLALLYWRFLFCFIPKLAIPPRVFIGLLFVAIIIGGGSIAASRGLVITQNPIFSLLVKANMFLPFFALGYYCPSKVLDKIRTWNKLPAYCVLALVFVFLYLGGTGLIHKHLWGSLVTHGSFLANVLYQLLYYCIALLCCVSMLSISSSLYAKWGSQTQTIYLLHGILVYMIYYKIVLYYQLPVNLLSDVFVSAFILALCLWLARFRAIDYLVSPMLLLGKKKKR